MQKTKEKSFVAIKILFIKNIRIFRLKKFILYLTVETKENKKVFEEFKGVLTGSVVDKPYLSQDDYLNLGVKQSIFSQEERPVIYDLFSRYIAWLKESNYFDSNLHAYEILDLCKPIYDYVVIDEVQDITNVQLMAILKSLENSACNALRYS